MKVKKNYLFQGVIEKHEHFENYKKYVILKGSLKKHRPLENIRKIVITRYYY